MREPPARSPLHRWSARHLSSVRSSLIRLLRKPASALLTISVVALALSLPLGLWLGLSNLERLPVDVEHSRAINLFLTPETSAVRAKALAQQLLAWDDVITVEHHTPEQGLAELRAQGMDEEVNEILRENPLPHLLRVMPMGDDTQLTSTLAALPEVELMLHDARWQRQVEGWLRVGNRLVWILGGLFGLGCVLVVGNTVRLDFQSRHEEMNVLQLIGASNDFIRRPFVYLGMWYGFLGGVAAIGILVAAGMGLRAALVALVSDGNSLFVLQDFTVREIAVILLSSSTLCALSARLVSGYLLHRNAPGE